MSPTVTALESLRLMMLRVRELTEQRAQAGTAIADTQERSIRALTPSLHPTWRVPVVTVTNRRLDSPWGGSHWLDMLEALESVVTDASFTAGNGILVDYRQYVPPDADPDCSGEAASLRMMVVGAFGRTTGEPISRTAMLLRAETDLTPFPHSLFSSVAHGRSHNFRVFTNEHDAATWIAGGDPLQAANTMEPR
jgi:hypothetical protein